MDREKGVKEICRVSEEWGCLVPDRGPEVQRRRGSEGGWGGGGISLSPGLHPGAADEAMGMAQAYRLEGPFRSKDSCLCISLFPLLSPLTRSRCSLHM